MKKSLTVALVLALVFALGIVASGCRRTTPSPSPTLMPSPTSQPSPTMETTPEVLPSPTMEVSPSPAIEATPQVTPAASEAPTGSNNTDSQSAGSNGSQQAGNNVAAAPEQPAAESVAVTATAAQKVSDAIVKLDGIQSVTVVLSNGTCLTGITLADGTQWNNTLLGNIRRAAMETDKAIEKTAITADAELVEQIKTIADDVKARKDTVTIATTYDALVTQIGPQ